MGPAMMAGNPTFCGSCGKPLDPSAQFCGACGAHVARPAPAAAPPAAKVDPSPAASRSMGVLVAAIAAAVLVAAGIGAFVLSTQSSGGSHAAPAKQPATTTPDTGTVESSSPPPTTEAAGPSAEEYSGNVQQALAGSRDDLRRIVAAISDAQNAPGQEAAVARSVLDDRRALLAEVQGWAVPPDAQPVQSGLVRSLQLSIVSDAAYEQWMAALARGDKAAADAAYSRAQSNDPLATAAKRAFLRAYNRYRTSAGLAPVSTAKLF
jgi:zinc ribbon protein